MTDANSPRPMGKSQVIQVERSSNIENEMEELKRMRDAEMLRIRPSDDPNSNNIR